ncbi:MAG TPA: putative aminohydrolase SsnA, partial [bacterium]|nr:putative aminohydrolase SsnA [bacterium]
SKKGLVKNGWVVVRDGRIAKIGDGDYKKETEGEKVNVINADGKMVLPGFINAHTHLYSTLARGIRLAGPAPRNFLEQLESLWWRLDRALTYEDTYWSSLVGSILSLKAGVTTVCDHHSSPFAIDRSLDAVARGMTEAGLRGSVCYEVSDRDGQDRASLGIYENVRFARSLAEAPNDRLAAMMGLHASFTLSQPTLLRARDAASELGLGFHLHVAEDTCDVTDSQKRYRRRVVTRLQESGILSPKTLAVHCVHVNESEIMLLAKTGASVIHCPRSNLSNAVGIAQVGKMFRHGIRVGFGSDGFGFWILEDALAGMIAWRLAEHAPTVAAVETELMLLRNNPVIASALFEDKIGELAEGFRADVIILDYESPTPVERGNLWTHLLMGDVRVNTVLVGGRVVVEDGQSTLLDEALVFEKARSLAAQLWRRV